MPMYALHRKDTAWGATVRHVRFKQRQYRRNFGKLMYTISNLSGISSWASIRTVPPGSGPLHVFADASLRTPECGI